MLLVILAVIGQDSSIFSPGTDAINGGFGSVLSVGLEICEVDNLVTGSWRPLMSLVQFPKAAKELYQDRLPRDPVPYGGSIPRE